MFFKKRSDKEIIFTNLLGFHTSSHPVPATQGVPEWYKKMPNRVPEVKVISSMPTIKKCVPVFDAMTAGYIIYTPCDVEVRQENGEPVYEPSMPEVIQLHGRRQGYLHPDAKDFNFPKWINGWAIRTPKGYSSLLVPPMHQPNPWFECLPGLVDTDTYTNVIHFPFVLKNTKFEGIIPAGTPMMQVIPFKRDDWKMSLGGADEIERAKQVNQELKMYYWDRYKRLFRTPKNWNKS